MKKSPHNSYYKATFCNSGFIHYSSVCCHPLTIQSRSFSVSSKRSVNGLSNEQQDVYKKIDNMTSLLKENRDLIRKYDKGLLSANEARQIMSEGSRRNIELERDKAEYKSLIIDEALRTLEKGNPENKDNTVSFALSSAFKNNKPISNAD